ncbi:MAG: hypothetical protein KGS72_16610 [Cyanobacteria bacterium REEB67]|jgi:hypothetical protein|nr:hypothetical protein [Cyanobacteria bacterium REEB67]
MRDYTITWKGYIGARGNLESVTGEERISAETAKEALQSSINSIRTKLHGGDGYAIADVSFNPTNESLNLGEITDILRAVNAEGGLQKDSFVPPLHYVKNGTRVDPVYATIRFEGRASVGSKKHILWAKRRVVGQSVMQSLESIRQIMIDEFKKHGNAYVLDSVLLTNIPIHVNTDDIYDFFKSFNDEGGMEPLPTSPKRISMVPEEDGGQRISPVRS